MKKFWQHRVTHFIMVLLVFAVTGYAVAKISAPLTIALGIAKFSALYWIVWIVVLLPVYQVVLLLVALIFCKYSYFREKQKKLIGRITWIFRKKSTHKHS